MGLTAELFKLEMLMAGLPSDACPRCGKPVACGMKTGMARCWCADYPPMLKVPAAESGAGCYCPECLKAVTEAALLSGPPCGKSGGTGG